MPTGSRPRLPACSTIQGYFNNRSETAPTICNRLSELMASMIVTISYR
ncbi:hypothetical protein L479_01598 [Exiguobacterium sp. S17]|nr:hypothetical protein L479_01598 [Exiguobacterium sp. S17]